VSLAFVLILFPILIDAFEGAGGHAHDGALADESQEAIDES
jgi:hypothetical protein